MSSRKKKPSPERIYHDLLQRGEKLRMADFKICKILRNFHYEIYF